LTTTLHTLAAHPQFFTYYPAARGVAASDDSLIELNNHVPDRIDGVEYHYKLLLKASNAVEIRVFFFSFLREYE
jgi:hypothetical protein